MASGSLVSRVYGNFRGVDFRGDEISLARSPDSVNMWKDYKEIDSIRTRPGMELLSSFTPNNTIDKEINAPVGGIHFYKAGDTEMMIIHQGKTLYKVVNGVQSILYYGVVTSNTSNLPSNSFIYNNVWYFMDGLNYLQYDGAEIKEVEGYVPTTSIARKPAGGGEIYQDVNMLSDYRINTFVGDGKSIDLHLDVPDCEEIAEVRINGEVVNELESYTQQYISKGVVRLIHPAPEPATTGQANIEVKFKKRSTDRNKIARCTIVETFDNRIFYSGNPEHPNAIWHSGLNDPTYCSDLDRYNEGLDTASVKGMVAGNNALWVFKEPSQANTTIFYHTPTIDSEYGKIYPNTHSNISTGCVGKAINFNDDIVFFSDRGMEGISGDVTTEQAVSHRSTLVDRKLVADGNYEQMFLVEWEGYLMVICGRRVYLADSRALFTNENHYEYEWFYWEFDMGIKCAKVHNGTLYLGCWNGKIYTLTDTTGDVFKSYWATPKDKFKHPQYLKTTNKRGCVVEATGDIILSAKTEKSSDFEQIGHYENIEDSFVSRMKLKKFKDIQLLFGSSKRFTLETATLECFIGGYIKR